MEGHFLGNFKQYYCFNPPQERLDAIPVQFWQDLGANRAKVRFLDVGCNNGTLTEAFREILAALPGVEEVSAFGIDVDETLIAQARKSFANCAFIIANAAECLKFDERFDLVTCFGTTMWVHLNEGEDGLEKMLRNLARWTKANGTVLLEPQLWRSYRNAKKRLRKCGAKVPLSFTSLRIENQEELFTFITSTMQKYFSNFQVIGETVNWKRPVLSFSRKHSMKSLSEVNWEFREDDNFRSKPVIMKENSTLILTRETETLRKCFQLISAESFALEISCSFGSGTEILTNLLQDPVNNYIGVDVSLFCIKACSKKLPNLKFFRFNALTAWKQVEAEVRNRHEPFVIVLDIGGNRGFGELVALLPSVLKLKPKQLFVKCEQLHERWSVHRNVESVIEEARAILNRENLRPENAPRRHIHGKELCRFHNYHENGCKKQLNGTCTRNHSHCHRCLDEGHRAIACVDFDSEISLVNHFLEFA